MEEQPRRAEQVDGLPLLGDGQPRRAAEPRDTAPDRCAMPAARPGLSHRELTGKVIRACHVVHDELGAEFLESVYEAAVAVVLLAWGVRVERQRALDVVFWGEVVGSFRADLVVADTVLVELKAVSKLVPAHSAQVLNYLKGSGLRVALLVNFGSQLEVKRLVR
jgi:GxxExxY protein